MSAKSTLYDLSAEGLAIFDMLDEALGELSPELEARLDKLMLEGPERLEAAACVVRTLEANAGACEMEAQRLRDRAKAFDAQAVRLKERMTLCLDTAFHGKVKTPLFTIWTQKSADRIVADLVPGVTAEILHKERPDLVRVKMELDREKCVAEFAPTWEALRQIAVARLAEDYAAIEQGEKALAEAQNQHPLPELILFEEKPGERSVRIR